MTYRSIGTVSNELFGSGKKKPELTDDIKKKIRDKYSRKPKSLQEEYKLFNEISHSEKTNKGPYTKYWQEFQKEWKRINVDLSIPSDLKYVVLDHNGSLGFYYVRMPETLKGVIGDFDPEEHIGKDKYENKIKEIETKLGKGVVIAHDSEYTSLLYLSKKGLTELIFDRDFEKNDWLVPNDKINVGNHLTPITFASVLAKYNVYVQVHIAFKQYKEGKLTLEHFNIGTTMTKFTLIPTISEEAFDDIEKKANISTKFFGLRSSMEDIQPDSENIPTQEIVEASTKTDTDVTDNPVESSTETKESTTTEDPVDEYMNDEIETSLIVLDVDSQTGEASDNSTEETPTDSSTDSDGDGLDDAVQDNSNVSDQATGEDTTTDDSTSDSADTAESGESTDANASTDDAQDEATDKESELEEEKENFTADDLTNDKEEAKQVEEENPELDKKVENDTDEDATSTTTDSTDDTSDTSDGGDTEESSSELTDTATDDKPASTQSETTEIEETEETTTETELNPAQEALYDLLEMRHALVHSSLSTEDYRAIRKHLGYVTLNYLREEAPKLKLLSMEEMTSPQKDLLHSVHTAIESLREKYQLSQVQYSFEDATTMTNEDITLSMEKITLGTFGKAFKNVFFNSGEPAYNSLAAINGIFFRAFGKAYWVDPDKLKNRGAIEKKVNEILDQIDRDSEIHWAMIEKNIISTPQYIPISTKEEWDAIRSKVNTVKDKWKKKYDKKTLKAIKEKDSKKYKDLIRRSGAMSSILDVCRKLPKLKKK